MKGEFRRYGLLEIAELQEIRWMVKANRPLSVLSSVLWTAATRPRTGINVDVVKLKRQVEKTIAEINEAIGWDAVK